MASKLADTDRIFFDLQIDLPKKINGDESVHNTFLGELVIENVADITLKVFFELKKAPKGIMGWRSTYAHTLLSCFKVTKIRSPEYLLEIDFKDYVYIGMKSSTDFVDATLGLQYFTIQLGGIALKYNLSGESHSEVYLNETALKLVELYYDYSGNFPSSEKFAWEPKNRLTNIRFGKIEFIPEHFFYQDGKNSGKEVIIKKDPRLKISNQGLDHHTICAHVDLLCVLFSFYTNKQINWTVRRIRTEGFRFVDRRVASNQPVEVIHGLFIWDFIQNPMNLIMNVSVEKLLCKLNVVSSMVERFNYGLVAPDETKFMVLYSVLEQVRNEYILDGLIDQELAGNPPDLKKVKEEFSFRVPNKDANASIKLALEQVIPIIHEDEVEKFKEEISIKLSMIKLHTMTSQFDSLFKYLNVDPQTFKLDFKMLKKLRDNIFHGRLLTGEDLENLKKVIWYEHLPRLTGIVMLKYFGIDDLASMEKKSLH